MPKSNTPNKKKQSESQIKVFSQAVTIVVVVLIVVVAVVVGIYLKDKGGQTPAPQPQPGEIKQYASLPDMTIDTGKVYIATFTLEKGGEFVVELYADKAPITVNNFIFLAKDGYYDGVTFHRVLTGFMAQSGDPTGTGSGGPGYSFEDEISDLTFDKPGLLAMANGGPGTNGSQFFITYVPTEWLNGKHTIFGQVISGLDVVEGLTERDPEQAPTFTGDVIKTIIISEK